jgi:hypothetical protein
MNQCVVLQALGQTRRLVKASICLLLFARQVRGELRIEKPFNFHN